MHVESQVPTYHVLQRVSDDHVTTTLKPPLVCSINSSLTSNRTSDSSFNIAHLAVCDTCQLRHPSEDLSAWVRVIRLRLATGNYLIELRPRVVYVLCCLKSKVH